MISAGSITVKCGDPNDRSTRLVAERLVARFASKHYRIFKASSGLQGKKKVLLDAYVNNPGDKGTLIKIMRGVRWNQLSKSYTAYFMRDFAASSAGKVIAMKYNRRSLNKYHVIPVWRQVFTNRLNTRQCSANPSGTVFRPTPLPLPRPVTPTNPQPRPADKQIARQNGLVAAVRKVYGASTSESAAKTVLKTQKWSTLKQLGITTHIMRAFGELGYRRASKIGRVARRLVKKTLRNWKKSSAVTPQTPPRPTPRPAPAPTPRTRPTAPSITSAQRKTYVTAALLTALKTKGLASTTAETIAFAKGQTWRTLKALKLHIPFIAALNAETRLGKWRPIAMSKRNQARAAQKLYLSLKR